MGKRIDHRDMAILIHDTIDITPICISILGLQHRKIVWLKNIVFVGAIDEKIHDVVEKESGVVTQHFINTLVKTKTDVSENVLRDFGLVTRFNNCINDNSIVKIIPLQTPESTPNALAFSLSLQQLVTGERDTILPTSDSNVVYWIEDYVYSFDTLLELKNKIYIYTRLLPSAQCFLQIDEQYTHGIPVSFESVGQDFIDHFISNTNFPLLHTIPIDEAFISLKEKEFKTNELKYVTEFLDKHRTLSFIPLDAILPNHLDNMSQSDINKIVEGAIMKFYPRFFSGAVLKEYLRGALKNELYGEYEDTLRWFKRLGKVTRAISSVTASEAKELIENVLLTTVVLSNKEKRRTRRIDIRTLFDVFDTTNEIPIIIYYTGTGAVVARQDKSHYALHGKYDIEEKVHGKKTEHKILFKIRLSDVNVNSMYHSFATVTLFPSGYLKLYSPWSEEHWVTLKELYSLITRIDNSIISKIDTFGNIVTFNNYENNKLIHLYHHADGDISIGDLMESVNMTIIFKPANYITPSLIRFIKELSPFINEKIITVKIAKHTFMENRFVLTQPYKKKLMVKGISAEKNEFVVMDERMTLDGMIFKCVTKYTARIQMLGIKSMSSLITFMNKICRVVPLFVNRNQHIQKLIEISQYFKTFTKIPTKEVKISEVQEIPKTVRKLKKLQEIDPVLYAYHKLFKNYREYASICQQLKHPIIYTQEEYDHLPDSVKKNLFRYINMTHSTTENIVYSYYDCSMNKRHKNIGFLDTKYHPRSYCIICCSTVDIPATAKPGSKKRKLFEQCKTFEQRIKSKDHPTSVEIEETSETFVKPSVKYISSFTGNPANGRVFSLPPLLDMVFNHEKLEKQTKSTLEYCIYSTHKNIFRFASAVLCCSPNITSLEKLQSMMVNDLEHYTKDFIFDAIDHIDTVDGLFDSLNGGKVKNIYASTDNIKKLINNAFSKYNEVTLLNTKVERRINQYDEEQMLRHILQNYLHALIIVLRSPYSTCDFTLDCNEIKCIESIYKKQKRMMPCSYESVIFLLQSDQGFYFPIILVSLYKYSVSYKHVHKINQTRFSYEDKILKDVLTIISSEANNADNLISSTDSNIDQVTLIENRASEPFYFIVQNCVFPNITGKTYTLFGDVVAKIQFTRHQMLENDVISKVFVDKLKKFLSITKTNIMFTIVSKIGNHKKYLVGFKLDSWNIVWVKSVLIQDVKRIIRNIEDIQQITIPFSTSVFDLINTDISSGTIKIDTEKMRDVITVRKMVDMYMKFELTIFAHFLLERNDKLRQKLIEFLSKYSITAYKYTPIEEITLGMKQIIKKYWTSSASDISKIPSIISDEAIDADMQVFKNSVKFYKFDLVLTLNSTAFEFDNIPKYTIISIASNTDLPLDKRKMELIKFLHKRCKGLFTIVKTYKYPFNNSYIKYDNIITTCEEEKALDIKSHECVNGSMTMTKENYIDFMSRFVNDIVQNEYRRLMIMNGIFSRIKDTTIYGKTPNSILLV